MAKSNNQKQSNGSNLDFEAQLWAAADKMPRMVGWTAGVFVFAAQYLNQLPHNETKSLQ